MRVAPPLEAIEAFVVAAQARSFRAAAEELALSPSALSRRVQRLEAAVGRPLFIRSAGRIALTSAGRRYLRSVGPAIEAIRKATSSLRDADRHAPLRVMAPQSFALGWLMARLPDLRRQHGVATDLVIGSDQTRLRAGEVDVAIMAGPRDFGDLPVEPLLHLDAVAASAPLMADGREPPRSIEDLRRYPLLGVDVPGDLWPAWVERVVAGPAPGIAAAQSFATLALMFEAAASGFGIALAAPVIAERVVAEGRLRPCFPARAALGFDYRLVYADRAAARRADAVAFKGWMHEEVARSVRRFEEAMSMNA